MSSCLENSSSLRKSATRKLRREDQSFTQTYVSTLHTRIIPDHLVSIEAQLKGLPACAVPSKRTRASLRFDGYGTDTSLRIPCAWGGKACTGKKGAPRASCPRRSDKGRRGTRGPTAVFTRLGLRGFWGGEREGRDEMESRERRGSRKSDPEPVDCGALARLGQSSYCNLAVPARLCAHVRVCTQSIARSEDFFRISNYWRRRKRRREEKKEKEEEKKRRKRRKRRREEKEEETRILGPRWFGTRVRSDRAGESDSCSIDRGIESRAKVGRVEQVENWIKPSLRSTEPPRGSRSRWRSVFLPKKKSIRVACGTHH